MEPSRYHRKSIPTAARHQARQGRAGHGQAGPRTGNLAEAPPQASRQVSSSSDCNTNSGTSSLEQQHSTPSVTTRRRLISSTPGTRCRAQTRVDGDETPSRRPYYLRISDWNRLPAGPDLDLVLSIRWGAWRLLAWAGELRVSFVGTTATRPFEATWAGWDSSSKGGPRSLTSQGSGRSSVLDGVLVVGWQHHPAPLSRRRHGEEGRVRQGTSSAGLSATDGGASSHLVPAR